MTSHKERLEAANKKGFSLPRNYNTSQNGLSNSHLQNNEKRAPHSTVERMISNNDSEYQEPISSKYFNLQSEKVTFADYNDGESVEKAIDRQPLYESQPKINTNKTNNTSKSYLSMNEPRTLAKHELIYKSQSLNALKSKEPSKVLMKSSIQQEYHDKRVQHSLKGISSGKSRKPFIIATVFFFLFGLIFITGLTLICLTYIYKNINFSLDKGEMIGPVIMAGSFIFLGIAIKFIYDAHKMSRKERKTLAFSGYDRHYVGLKSGRNGTLMGNEKLVSGTATDIGLSRIPNRKQPPNDNRTIGRSSQHVYGKNNEDSHI